MFLNECKSFTMDELDITPVLDDEGNPDRNLNPGDYIRHFKGNVYRILGTSIHTESTEQLVIYETVTTLPKKVYARPLDMFMSEVDHDKYPDATQKWRLEKVSIKEKHPKRKDITLEISFNRQSEELCGKIMSEFLCKYNSEIHSIRTWNTDAKDDIFRVDPPGYAFHVIEGKSSGIRIDMAKHVKDGLMIHFNIGSKLHAGAFYGDTIYTVGEDRLVILNSKDKKYEVFDIVSK